MQTTHRLLLTAVILNCESAASDHHQRVCKRCTPSGGLHTFWGSPLEVSPGGLPWRSPLEVSPGGLPWGSPLGVSPGGLPWRTPLEATSRTVDQNQGGFVVCTRQTFCVFRVFLFSFKKGSAGFYLFVIDLSLITYFSVCQEWNVWPCVVFVICDQWTLPAFQNE